MFDAALRVGLQYAVIEAAICKTQVTCIPTASETKETRQRPRMHRGIGGVRLSSSSPRRFAGASMAYRSWRCGQDDVQMTNRGRRIVISVLLAPCFEAVYARVVIASVP